MVRDRRPSWPPQGSARRGIPGLLLTLALLTGGACTPARKPYNVSQVSRNGAGLYLAALQRRWESQARDERGRERRESLSTVVRELKAAVSNDPTCSLFHSKLGEVLLNAGQGDLAKDSFDTSLDLCADDWVPGWLGLAQWATERIPLDPAKIEEADHYLFRAEQAIKNIRLRWSELPTDQRGSLGLGKLGLPVDSTDDGLPSERAGVGLVIDWLCANEHPALFAGTSVFRRLRARIGYQAALIAAARGEPASTVINHLLVSHRSDPDFVPAQLERARQHHKRGEYANAEDILLPVLRANPLYRDSAELRFELARIYSGWCLETFADEQCHKAEEAFVRLHEINDNHIEGWLARAEMNYAVGGRLGKRAWLDNAKKMVDFVLGIQPNHPRASHLLEEIDKAIKEHTPEDDK